MGTFNRRRSAHSVKKGVMKITKKVKGPTIRGPFVAIGKRKDSTLCAIPELDILLPPLVLGENPVLPKIRGGDDVLWKSSCSWVSSKKVGKFLLLKLTDALAKKKVKMIKKVTFVRKSDGHKFVGDIIVPADWEPSMAQPRCIGVLNAKGWPTTRIESEAVRENDGSEPRNQNIVAKLVLKK